jgi:hypothetical protein
MALSRREFLKLFGSLVGGWALAMPKFYFDGEMIRIPVEMSDLDEQEKFTAGKEIIKHDKGAGQHLPNSSSTIDSRRDVARWKREIPAIPESDRLLNEIGHFNEISPERYVFDESKYSRPKRKLEPSEWDRTNRHLPIKIDPGVINKPGERSPQALMRVVEYTPFNNPRYVAAPGERVTMCNIAAWDWSRALQVHLPHWVGETEMSANMLFRWISHPQAGGIYGEGWQPVKANAAQLLAFRGIPVFALAESSVPRRRGHVAMVYPFYKVSQAVLLYFASVNNGRSGSGNGIKSLPNTFRWLKPTYFVHKDDFVVYQDS